jgi:hypothetical protein
MQVGPCIHVGIQLEKAEVGPTSGPTWRLSYLRSGRAARAEGLRHRRHRVGGLRGFTRAHCYLPLTFLVTIGILHINENGEGQ